MAEQVGFDLRKEESGMTEKVAGSRDIGSPVKSGPGLEWMGLMLIP